jgi:rare lipoprotein A
MGASNAAGVSRGAVLALAGLSLAACASVGPRYPVTGSNPVYSDSGSGGAKPSSRYNGYHVGKPYQINGRWYYPAEQPDYDEIGTASWYGEQFHNHYTADGEVFDMNLPSAAHKTLPLPSLVEVTNLANGRKLILRVNDRGPFYGGRLIDLSKQAAIELGFYGHGTAQVRVRYVGPAPLPGNARVYQASGPTTPGPAKQPASEGGVQLASANAVLGAQIDARPIQPSPSTLSWSASSRPAPSGQAPSGQPAPPAPAPTQLAYSEPPAAVQTGAFSTRASAEHAAAALDGQTQIVPIEQSGRTLYRVMLIH